MNDETRRERDPRDANMELVEVRATVRTELLQRVLHCLKDADVPRITVERVHAIGSGVHPAKVRISSTGGSEYADKAVVRFICPDDRTEMYCELISSTARTGVGGDGIISIHPVLELRKIRTGARGLDALA